MVQSQLSALQQEQARQLAMYLLRAKLQWSGADVGRAFARDHSTVYHAFVRIGRLIRTDTEIAGIASRATFLAAVPQPERSLEVVLLAAERVQVELARLSSPLTITALVEALEDIGEAAVRLQRAIAAVSEPAPIVRVPERQVVA